MKSWILLALLVLPLGCGIITSQWDDEKCPVQETSPGTFERVCKCKQYRITAKNGVATQTCDDYKVPVTVKYDEVRDATP